MRKGSRWKKTRPLPCTESTRRIVVGGDNMEQKHRAAPPRNTDDTLEQAATNSCHEPHRQHILTLTRSCCCCGCYQMGHSSSSIARSSHVLHTPDTTGTHSPPALPRLKGSLVLVVALQHRHALMLHAVHTSNSRHCRCYKVLYPTLHNTCTHRHTPNQRTRRRQTSGHNNMAVTQSQHLSCARALTAC